MRVLFFYGWVGDSTIGKRFVGADDSVGPWPPCVKGAVSEADWGIVPVIDNPSVNALR